MNKQTESPDDVLQLTTEWYKGKLFSADWTSHNFPHWVTLLKPFRDIAAQVVEVGSWEGRSALFFLNYLPRARLVCIDTFEVGDEWKIPSPALAPALARWGIDSLKFDPNLERRFDANVALFVERIQKIRAPSNMALAQLGIEERKFDIAYIDGSHRTSDVYTDAVLTWPMMLPRGIVIFDDYYWEDPRGSPEHPKQGIDCFLKAFQGQYRIVHSAYQLAIEKL